MSDRRGAEVTDYAPAERSSVTVGGQTDVIPEDGSDSADPVARDEPVCERAHRKSALPIRWLAAPRRVIASGLEPEYPRLSATSPG